MKKRAKTARNLRGIKAKIHNKERRNEKIQMKKTIKAHQEKKTKGKIIKLSRYWKKIIIILIKVGSSLYLEFYWELQKPNNFFNNTYISAKKILKCIFFLILY